MIKLPNVVGGELVSACQSFDFLLFLLHLLFVFDDAEHTGINFGLLCAIWVKLLQRWGFTTCGVLLALLLHLVFVPEIHEAHVLSLRCLFLGQLSLGLDLPESSR